jgi:hypothetical protein
MAMENTTEYLWEPADIIRRVQLLRRILPNKTMDETRLKKLLELADDQDQVKLKVLYNAVIKGVNEYNKNSAQAKLKNWKSAEKELDLYIDKLWSKYIDHERTFPNLLAVIDYLKNNNWNIGKSRVYEHKKEGKIKAQENGTFRLSDVEKYAATFLKRTDGSTGSEADRLQVEKVQVDLDISKEKREQLQLKNKVMKGLFVPKDAFERELAQRAIVFKSDVEAFCRSKAAEIVNLVGGEKDRIPDLVEYMLGEAAAWLNRYAADREFIVPAAAPADIFEDPDKDFDEGEE